MTADFLGAMHWRKVLIAQELWRSHCSLLSGISKQLDGCHWEMALLKDLRLTESKMLEFRTEFFKAFNHAQFNAPKGNILNSAFAR